MPAHSSNVKKQHQPNGISCTSIHLLNKCYWLDTAVYGALELLISDDMGESRICN